MPNAADEFSRSYWQRTTPVIEAAAMDQDRSADVAVVGAGITGLSAAYELSRAGRSVVVLDRGKLGGGMTGRTTAHLASELDDYYASLIEQRGMEDARSYYSSQAAAIDRIEHIASTENIDCAFRRLDGYLFLAPGTEPDLLDRERRAAGEVGLVGVDWAERAPIEGVDTGRCLRFPGQARFHPLRYLHGLVACIRRDCGLLFAETPVVDVIESEDHVEVRTAEGASVRAGAAIVATNSPISNLLAIHTKQAPYRTYVIAASVPRGSVADTLLWDTLDVRLQPDEASGDDVLIVGGEDHKTGTAGGAAERFARLETWARGHFLSMGKITDRWSGQVMEPVDHLYFAGRNHGNDRVFIATGDSGQGMTNGVAAGLLIADLIMGRDNAWAGVFNPRRVTVGSTGEFLKENVGVVANIAERLTPGEISSLEDLRPGEGAIVRKKMKKIAAYRDEDGRLYERSAICTHAGCVVHWNAFERCWDCPCHGSHFAVDGTPLNGPAVMALAPPEDT